MANTISKSEYARQRDNYLRSIRRYRARLSKEGVSFDFSKYIPKIPSTLDKTPKQVEKEFNKLRDDLAIAVGSKRRQQKALAKKQNKAKKYQPKNALAQGQKSKDIKKARQDKVKAIQTPTPTAPKLSDAVLTTFEREFTFAENFKSSKSMRNNKYEQAVNLAGSEANDRLSLEINRIYRKYMPDITEPQTRVAVSERLEGNFSQLWDAMEQFLYEFISDGQGGLDHTTAGISGFIHFMETVSGTQIDIADKKKLNELANATVTGAPVRNPDKTEA